MKIAVYGFPEQYNHTPHIQELFIRLQSMGVSVLVHSPFYEFMKDVVPFSDKVQSFDSQDELKGCELLFSLGGDGTFLKTIYLVRDSGIPILGVNTGRLGFLASTSKEDISRALEQIVQKRYSIESRSLISMQTTPGLFGNNNFALNEASVLKKDSSSMITIHAHVNGEYLNTYRADGLIISTPTGSTAYSLSCGGPIVLPVCNNFLITPIAPHNLNVRPLVIPDTSSISLQVESRDNNYLLSLDSVHHSSDSKEEIVIKKAAFSINVVKPEGDSFFNTMRNKLMWGLDKRN